VTISKKGLSGIDFDEAKEIAAQVDFDAMEYARTKRSCGPGCTYLANDKRYFVTMLVRHIDMLAQSSQPLPPRVYRWRAKAQDALDEYKDVEKRLGRIKNSSRT